MNIGDRVLAQWEQQWWYPGVIVAVNGAGIVVQFDDGDRAPMSIEQARPLSYSVGDRVFCRWKGGDAYYPGVVSAVIGSAISIDYEDGDKETTTLSMVRINEADLH